MKRIFLSLYCLVAGILSSFHWRLIYGHYRQRYAINPNFQFNGRMIIFYGVGSIEAGGGSYIGELSTVNAAHGCHVKIGSGCSVSHNVRIYTQSTCAEALVTPLSEKAHKTGSVVIEDNCWIGANVFIGPGITIGENAVIGANSVVTKNVPSREIWGGVPAKLIRRKANNGSV